MEKKPTPVESEGTNWDQLISSSSVQHPVTGEILYRRKFLFIHNHGLIRELHRVAYRFENRKPTPGELLRVLGHVDGSMYLMQFPSEPDRDVLLILDHGLGEWKIMKADLPGRSMIVKKELVLEIPTDDPDLAKPEPDLAEN